MLFSSYEFMLFYLPIVLAGYFLLGRYAGKLMAHIWLVAASLLFYGWFNPWYLWIILTSMFANYFFISFIERQPMGTTARRVAFALGVVFDLGMIGYYKYADFFLSSCNAALGTALPLLHVALPLGISFFTFTQISCMVDAYKGVKLTNLSFTNYFLFVTYFPHLLAGPILHHQEMMPQFDKPEALKPDARHLSCGLHLLAIGLFKKLVVADQVAIWATRGFDQAPELTFWQAWFVALSYTLQIYFDFSGYCDMALGISKMFNIHLPINFNSPFRATDIRDFWQRWHITLGRFLTHYVYFPLGGNRQGLLRGCMNLLATFLISGLWHGAGWTYVLWGGMHGAALVVHRLWNTWGFSMHRWLGRFLTFMFFLQSMVLFRATSLDGAVKVWRGMVNFSDMHYKAIRDIVRPGFSTDGAVILVVVLVVVCLVCKNAAKRNVTFQPTLLRFAETVLFLTWSVLTMARISPFIYFNF